MVGGLGGVREEVRARPPTEDPWSLMRWAALFVGWANIVGGSLGFAAPLVFGNADRILNVSPGMLGGFTAINLPHGLFHAAVGLWGVLAARRGHEAAFVYTAVTGVLWAALLAAYFVVARGEPGTVMICGMAVDNGASVVHLFWVGIALILLANPLFRRGGRVVG